MQRGRGHAIDLLFEGLSEGLRGRPGVGVRHLAAYRETADVLARGNNWTAMMRWLRVLGNRQWGMGSLIMGEMGVTACTTVWDGTSVPRRTRRIALSTMRSVAISKSQMPIEVKPGLSQGVSLSQRGARAVKARQRRVWRR
jgi:hypothetical protein